MSLWKLRVGVEAYYLAQVARGLDEYYSGAGEAIGRWTGTASILLGLADDVAGEDLRAVLAGLAPGTALTPNGDRLVAHPRRLPGFDLTFSVPKSVSVVFALGDLLVQAAVVDGCETALAEAMGWLEREACFVRRGTNNRKFATDPAGFGTRPMIAEGFVAAQFSHRTSRMGDPHLHWHVLVANMARRIDGRWSAPDGTALYRAQRTVRGVVPDGDAPRAHDAPWSRVGTDAQRLGRDRRHPHPRLLREFSQRHEQIAEWLDTNGRSGAQAALEAQLALAQRALAVQHAEHEWAIALGRHGVAPGDADIFRRAVHTAADHAAHRLQADPPMWLTTCLGARPTTPAAASVWDAATTRVAHHRLLHDIPVNDHGIGTRPDNPIDSRRWQDLMLRLLEDRIWLADHPEPDVAPLVVSTPTELIDRQHEVQQILAAAPADQRQLIDRIVNSQLDATEMHEYLTAAMAGQNDRRDWIIANWPYVVELEQVTQLVAAQQPLAHWPAAQPDPVRDVLEQLRHLAPNLDIREERTLAQLDQQEIETDPVRQLSARREHLRGLAARTVSPAECQAIEGELSALGDQLREARRQQAVDRAFSRYVPDPIDDARATRITTLAHDTLTTQPAWVIDLVRQLHDNHQLNTRDVPTIATWITQAATHQDRHGQLPQNLPDPATPTIEVPLSNENCARHALRNERRARPAKSPAPQPPPLP